jgi:O-antigen ligase
MSTYQTRQVPLAVGLATAALACGWALTQHSKLIHLLPLVVAAPAMLLIFAEVGLTALWVWAPAAVITYPWLGNENHNVDFSRVWIAGLFVLLLTLPRSRASARSSSRLLSAFVLLTVVLGVRTATTHGTQGDYAYGFRIWAESLVLPLILFSVVRRTVAVKATAAERLALSLLVAGLLLALAGVAEKVTGVHLNTVRFDPAIGTVRLAGPFNAPEPYGLSLVLCLAATLLWLQMKQRGRNVQIAVLIISVIDLVAIFFTFFRVAWLAAIIVLIASFALRPQRLGQSLRRIAVAVLILGVVAMELDKVSTVSSRVNDTQSVEARFGAWNQGLELFRQNPLFGIGANQYTIVASKLPDATVSGTNSVPYPHNSFVLVFAEEGVAGGVALLFVCWAVFGLLRSLKRTSRSKADGVLIGTLIGAAIAYLAFSLTLAMLPFGPSNQIFAILLGIGAGTLDRRALTVRPVPTLHRGVASDQRLVPAHGSAT